jgi:hypothetical protein
MDTWMIIGAWVSAGLTLAMYSFLYGDNPFFKIAEHIYLGVSVGYTIVSTLFQYIIPKLWTPMLNGDYVLVVPAILGLLILTRLIPPIAWMSRISFAALMGYTAGLYVPTAVRQFILPQVGDTIQALWVPPAPPRGRLAERRECLGSVFQVVQQRDYPDWRDRGAGAFLLFGRAQRGDQTDRAAGGAVSDVRLWGDVRLHDDGPHVAAVRRDL